MTPYALYNEIDEYAADWLENLIKANLIAPGIVDRRSIEDLRGDDLRGFRQVHFFAGIGVWSYGLRRAGVSDDTAVWTGSCPCQPFSAAGKGGGVDDERHLWPALLHLIREQQPERFLGEQVASKDGLGWLDTVWTDLEAEGYAIGAFDTCSAGSGAPHIRQRLRIFAYNLRLAAGGLGNGDGARSFPGAHGRIYRGEKGPGPRNGEPERSGSLGGMADCADFGFDWSRGARDGRPGPPNDSAVVRLEHGVSERLEGFWNGPATESGRHGALRSIAEAGEPSRLADVHSTNTKLSAGERARPGEASGAGAYCELERRGSDFGTQLPGPTNGFWRDADWLFCRDGKWRPVEPGTFPLADGAAFRLESGSPFAGKSRQGMLKAYGNAIDAEATVDFIEACLAFRPADNLAAGSMNLEDLLG